MGVRVKILLSNSMNARTSRSRYYTMSDPEFPNSQHANLRALIGYIYTKEVPREKSTIHFHPCNHRKSTTISEKNISGGQPKMKLKNVGIRLTYSMAGSLEFFYLIVSDS